MVRSVLLAALVGTAAAFAPASSMARSSSAVALKAEMSESLPFLPRPEKLDGSMAGDRGFDPMGLSEIQQDLTYARWAELKHGRIAMLAIVGMIVQEYIHLPGEAYQNPDPFGAISTVGLGVNGQIFAAIGCVELINFNKHYDGSEPGDIGWTGGLLKNKSPAEIMKAKEQEITHCRLAMIAITGATVQTLLFHQPLLG
uniref:FCPI-11 n=1 Tax=Chaetoceros neogracilis TaxID=240364 RepID=UPI00186589DE|nr:Chain C, FCPI-11 [Chaetoceros gracilis]